MRTATRILAIATSVLACAASAAVAAPPEDDLARTDLERAAFAALPAIVRVQVRVPVRAVMDGTRRVQVTGPPLTVTATGFAVGPHEIVTARHVALPPREILLDGLRARLVPGIAGMARPRIVHGPITYTLTRAETAASDASGAAPPRQVTAMLVATSTLSVNDVAILRATEPGPYLGLADAHTARTPVAIVGFGDRDGIVPAVRIGSIVPQAVPDTGPEGSLVALEVPIRRGDSGAPVLGADGHVHGVVIRRRNKSKPPVAANAGVVRAMVTVPHAGVTVRAPFAQAMDRFWARDYARAEEALRVLERMWPDVRLIAYERGRADGLAQAAVTVSHDGRLLRAPLVVLAAAALLTASALLVIRLRME